MTQNSAVIWQQQKCTFEFVKGLSKREKALCEDAEDVRSEKLQNKNSRIFRIFVPKFSPNFAPNFPRIFSRSFRASFHGKRRPEKINENPHLFSIQKFPDKHETNMVQSTLLEDFALAGPKGQSPSQRARSMDDMSLNQNQNQNWLPLFLLPVC